MNILKTITIYPHDLTIVDEYFLTSEVTKTTLGAKMIFTSSGDNNPKNDPNGCWAYVGKHASVGGADGQSINLSRGCVNMGTVLHEVMHSLGRLCLLV